MESTLRILLRWRREFIYRVAFVCSRGAIERLIRKENYLMHLKKITWMTQRHMTRFIRHKFDLARIKSRESVQNGTK